MNEYRATNLDEGEEYEFRVSAINAVGPGEASDPSKGCVCRARKRKKLLYNNKFFQINEKF